MDINQLIKDGWVYNDLPKMTTELFNKFIEIAGGDNLKFLTYAEYSFQNKKLVRGQYIISPQGQENIRIWLTNADQKKDLSE